MSSNRKSRQRSLRKTRATSDDDEEQPQPVMQAADIIEARKMKKKEARKQALLGGNTGAGAGASVDLMAGRSTDEYNSISKMNAMAKNLNVTISGSFRKDKDQADDGRVSMGFARSLAGGSRGAGAGGGGRLEDDDTGERVGHDDADVDADADADKGGDDENGAFAIPDDETIRKARQKREMLRSSHSNGHGNGREREAGAPADFIPTDGPVISRRATSSKHVSFAPVDVDMDVDVDVDVDAESFARDQIEKGMRTISVGRADRADRADRAGHPSAAPMDLKSMDATTLADDILGALVAQLERVEMTLKQHEHGIARTRENLTDATNRVFEDEKALERLSDDFEKAQEMRGYVRTLCSMLHEKSPILEELQHQSLQSRVERSRAVSGAAQVKANDLLITASKGVDAAIQALLSGASEADATLAAARAVSEADDELKRGDHIPVEMDEFGRDLNMAQRLLARAGAASSIEDAIGKADRAFSTRHEEIRLELRNVFADTDEQFASLATVRDRLASWKAGHGDQYDTTFMGLSAPALFAPFVRLELIQWNALDVASPSFTTQHWYSLLFDYGAQAPESDPDHQVIPSLVTQVVLPWVADLARNVWYLDGVDAVEGVDTSSPTSQSRALSAAVADIMVYYDRENSASYTPVGGLVDAITDKLRRAVDAMTNDTPAWMPSAVAVTQRARECRDAMFHRGTTLLSCVCAFRDVIPSANVDALIEPLGKTVVQLLRSCVASAPACAAMAARVCDALGAPDAGRVSGGAAGGALRSMLQSVRDIVGAIAVGEAERNDLLARIDSLYS